MTLGVAVLGGVQLARLAGTIRVGKRVARDDRRFVRRRQAGAPRVLIVGDSSAAGTGASSPGATVGGRLAGRYPDATIVNLAHVGSRTRDVAWQLRRLSRRLARRRAATSSRAAGTGGDDGRSRPYALLIIHTGGNDALHLARPRDVERALSEALAAGRTISERQLVVTGGNFAFAPGLPAPLTWVWSWWERQLRARFLRLCASVGATYVDLYRDAGRDPTRSDPSRYFAADGVHPSDANYRLWFVAIDRALRDRGLQVALSQGMRS